MNYRWWNPEDRAVTIIPLTGGVPKTVHFSADVVFCDLCGEAIEFTPVPVAGTNALCAVCFEQTFHVSLDAAARRDGIEITGKYK